jgi:predicted metal-binding membrane protein
MESWRDGPSGAFVMGLKHGAWCVGCCWALLLVLAVGVAASPADVPGLTVPSHMDSGSGMHHDSMKMSH